MEGVISWQQLLDIGNNASDGNLRSRLANIAINQVVMWVVMVRGDICSFPHSCDNLFQWIEARPANSTEQWNNVKQWNPSPPGVKYHFELLENIIKVQFIANHHASKHCKRQDLNDGPLQPILTIITIITIITILTMLLIILIISAALSLTHRAPLETQRVAESIV